jgi:hypothetical protein
MNVILNSAWQKNVWACVCATCNFPNKIIKIEIKIVAAVTINLAHRIQKMSSWFPAWQPTEYNIQKSLRSKDLFFSVQRNAPHQESCAKTVWKVKYLIWIIAHMHGNATRLLHGWMQIACYPWEAPNFFQFLEFRGCMDENAEEIFVMNALNKPDSNHEGKMSGW